MPSNSTYINRNKKCSSCNGSGVCHKYVPYGSCSDCKGEGEVFSHMEKIEFETQPKTNNSPTEPTEEELLAVSKKMEYLDDARSQITSCQEFLDQTILLIESENYYEANIAWENLKLLEVEVKRLLKKAKGNANAYAKALYSCEKKYDVDNNMSSNDLDSFKESYMNEYGIELERFEELEIDINYYEETEDITRLFTEA